MKFARLELIAVVACLALAGCGLIEQHMGGSAPGVASSTWVRSGNGAPPADNDDGRNELQPYVILVDVLRRADAQGRHPIFQHAFLAYQQNPTPDTRLRLALVLTETQQSAAELEVARDLFVDVLSDPRPMPPLVRKYAEARLHEIEQRLALYEEIASLKGQLAEAREAKRDSEQSTVATERRLRRVEEALSEANAKLQAVMNIEKDIGPSGKGTFP